MTVLNWETSGRIKIERAKKHIGDLETEIKSFHESRPYEVIGQDEANTGDWVIRARIKRQPPIAWGAIAGDATHNLRASLDILWRLVMYPRGGADDNRKLSFTIFDSAERFETTYGREIRGPPWTSTRR